MRSCEALRYLGAGADAAAEALVGEMGEVLKKAVRPAARHIVCDFELTDEGVYFAAPRPFVIKSEDIRKLLTGCRRAVVFAATLGSGVDEQIRCLQVRDMSRAVVFDACASSEIEDVCDEYTRGIDTGGLFLTDRFSPSGVILLLADGQGAGLM